MGVNMEIKSVDIKTFSLGEIAVNAIKNNDQKNRIGQEWNYPTDEYFFHGGIRKTKKGVIVLENIKVIGPKKPFAHRFIYGSQNGENIVIERDFLKYAEIFPNGIVAIVYK